MMHKNRVFRVATVESAEDLARKLTDMTWTPCSGFELEGLLFLNDSFSRDGAGEWAVFRDGEQIETITFS